MKVTGTGGVSQATGSKPGRNSGGGFRIAAPQGAAGVSTPTSVSGAASVMGVDALIALQEVGSPTERRRRSVARAGRILDVLERLKIGLLSGELTGGDLARLRSAVREERAATDDPKLEAVLNEIETRAEVELAKLESASR